MKRFQRGFLVKSLGLSHRTRRQKVSTGNWFSVDFIVSSPPPEKTIMHNRNARYWGQRKYPPIGIVTEKRKIAGEETLNWQKNSLQNLSGYGRIIFDMVDFEGDLNDERTIY